MFRPDVPNGPAGTLVDLGQLPGGSDETSVLGLNDYGQVVGGSTTATGMHAFLWTPTARNGAAGAMVDLGDLPGSSESAVAHAINSTGRLSATGRCSTAWTALGTRSGGRRRRPTGPQAR